MFGGCGGGTSTSPLPLVNNGTGGTTSPNGGTSGGTSNGPAVSKMEAAAVTGVSILSRLQVEAVGTGLSYQWSEVDASGNTLSPQNAVFMNDTAPITTLTFSTGTLPGKKFIKVRVSNSAGGFTDQTREVEFITGGRVVTITLTDQSEATQGDSIMVEIRNAADGSLTSKAVEFEFQVGLMNNSNVLKENPLKVPVSTAGINEVSFGQFLGGPDAGKSVEFSQLTTITGTAKEGTKVHFSGVDFSNPATGQSANSGKSTVLIRKIDP